MHSRLMKGFLTLLLMTALAAPVFATAVNGTDDPPGASDPDNSRTPFQNALAQAMAQRQNLGLPVPQISFERIDDNHAVPGGGRILMNARTTIRFDGPAQAGRDRWASLIVPDGLPQGATGYVHGGNYDGLIRSNLASAIPGIWERYTFGTEPRTITITETYTQHGDAGLNRAGAPRANVVSPNDLLLGFTLEGPGIDYHIHECLSVLDVDVACFTAGFTFDYGLGLRLPMGLAADITSPMLEGSLYSGTTSAHGEDWSAQQYTDAGAPAESGNEGVLRLNFFAGANLEVFGTGVVDFAIGPVNEDHSSSFTAPFGPTAAFNLPSLDIPIWDYDAGIGSVAISLKLTPLIGSEDLTADWNATGTTEASGGGSIDYHDPAVPIALGDVTAIDGPGNALITLDNFRYHFSRFDIAPEIDIKIDVHVTDHTFAFGLPGIDLGFITSGLSVGTHDGTADQVQITVPILNVPPTAHIDLTGSTVIQGQNVFIGTAGSPLALSGRSTDPGRDDLTLTWDYGDGAPSPDITHTFPVPHDITDTESHTFTSQCTFGVTFTSVDDDNASASDHALVMVEASQRSISHLAGWWQHELGRQGNVVIPTDKLECLLAMVDLVSAVFHEHRDASTIPAAFDVMFMGGNQGSAQQKLDRELLMAWLNFANGTWGFNEMLDTNGDGANDMTFAAFVGTFEAVRLNASSSDSDLRAATARLHQLNVARVGSYGPEEFLLPEDVPLGDPGPLYSPNDSPPDAQLAGAKPAVQAAPAAAKAFDGMRVQFAPGQLRISFAQANAGPVRLRIYDLSGRTIRSFEGDRGAGVSTIVWDAGAESVSPGVYFLQLESEGKVYRSKAALLR